MPETQPLLYLIFQKNQELILIFIIVSANSWNSFSHAVSFAAVFLVFFSVAAGFFTEALDDFRATRGFFAAGFFSVFLTGAETASFFLVGVQENTVTPSAGTLSLMEYSLSSHSSCLQVFALGLTIP